VRIGRRRLLVAGVGNIFLGDDGFGVEVVKHFAGRDLPDGVSVVDVGIRGIHLAYDLMDGCDMLVIVDAAARGTPPGTVSVIEAATPDPSASGPDDRPPILDPHGLAPHDLLATLGRHGVRPGRTLVVACEPADLTEGIGLSDPVRAAVPEAVAIVEAILARETAGATSSQRG
jgi:hydrogenase maturation protease